MTGTEAYEKNKLITADVNYNAYTFGSLLWKRIFLFHFHIHRSWDIGGEFRFRSRTRPGREREIVVLDHLDIICAVCNG